MARYVIKNEESIAIQKSLKKWGDIPVKSKYLDGIVKITNFRKYTYGFEVDVVFEGKIFVTVRSQKRDWESIDILKTHSISKIKLNRFLRKSALFDVQTRMNYFGIEIKEYYNISKIKWQ